MPPRPLALILTELAERHKYEPTENVIGLDAPLRLRLLPASRVMRVAASTLIGREVVFLHRRQCRSEKIVDRPVSGLLDCGGTSPWVADVATCRSCSADRESSRTMLGLRGGNSRGALRGPAAPQRESRFRLSTARRADRAG